MLNLWATIGSLPACLIQRTGVWNSTAVWGMVLVVVRATISGCVVASAGFVEILLRSPGGGAESKLFKNHGPRGPRAQNLQKYGPRGGCREQTLQKLRAPGGPGRKIFKNYGPQGGRALSAKRNHVCPNFFGVDRGSDPYLCDPYLPSLTVFWSWLKLF